MSFKPSRRIKEEEEEELNLNLNPMMDMFAVLIPALLMMSTVVEVSIIDISAPAINPAGADTAKKPDTDKPPLNLKVVIAGGGYIIESSVGPSPNAAGPEPTGKVTIPMVEKDIACTRYRGTKPPPRAKNAEKAKCDSKNANDRKNFWVYDLDALLIRVVQFKTAFPQEKRIIIEAGNDVEYESVVEVMDVTRDMKEATGDITQLFPEVVVSPGPL